MSTAKIKEALLMLRVQAPPGTILEKAVDDAEAELEAIEMAAKDAVYLDADEASCRWWESDDQEKWDGLTELLKSIAKDAK